MRKRLGIPSAVTIRGGWSDRDLATSTRAFLPDTSIASPTAFTAAAGHVESEARPLHVAVQCADRRPDRNLPPLDEPDVVVPERESARSGLVPQLQVRNPPFASVLAGERSDR